MLITVAGALPEGTVQLCPNSRAAIAIPHIRAGQYSSVCYTNVKTVEKSVDGPLDRDLSQRGLFPSE
jgi:hypothetical protein